MSNGAQAVAYLDRDFVLGPEAGHVNISGISGLATKTSYAIFLIQSILQHSAADEVATILFNVKYDDLLHIHKPRRGITDEEKSLWKRLGLNPEPWPLERVHYLLPLGSTGRPNVFTNHDDTPPHELYAYALRQSIDKLDLLFSDIPDEADTLGALIGEIREGIISDERAWATVQSWDDLLTNPPLVQQGAPQRFRNIHPASVGRFLRLLRRRVKTRQSGIFVRQLSNRMTTLEHAIGNIQGGHTYVVDIARITPEEQTLVFGDVLRTISNLYSDSGEQLSLFDDYELPQKLIIFVDELNKYAPSRGQARVSPILDQVRDIAERGRSFGIVLFSAQQFLSAVDSRVTGNSATKVLGRSDNAEINEGNYRFLDQDIRRHLTRLEKGELILSHPIYRQPIKIIFPQPAFRQSRA
jgi:DNA helicase HerA-like ATPase